jgi:hypothetical protein
MVASEKTVKPETLTCPDPPKAVANVVVTTDP